MNPILEQICRIGIIPVIAIDDAKKAVPLARSLVEGGLPAAEVTFRTCAAEEAMRAIAAEVPEMLLGAGTVLNHEQVDRALAAGAKFIVSPGFNPDTVRYAKAKGGLIPRPVPLPQARWNRPWLLGWRRSSFPPPSKTAVWPSSKPSPDPIRL